MRNGLANFGNAYAMAGCWSSFSRFLPCCDQGFAGAARTKLLTREGAIPARITAVVPPYEFPTRSQSAIPTESRKARTRSAADEKRQSKLESHSESPAPGMSGAKTVAFLASMGIACRQLNE